MATEVDNTDQAGTVTGEQQSAPTPGAILGQERLRRGLSEKEVADKLHITMHYVRAVESDRYDKLPGAVFAKGYIKSYAELLGLNSSELLASYGQFVNHREARKEEKQRIRSERRRARNLPWVYASVAGFVGAFALLWWINNPGADGEPNGSTAPLLSDGNGQTQGDQAPVASQDAPAPPPAIVLPVPAAAPDDAPLADRPVPGLAEALGVLATASETAAVEEPSRVIEVGGGGNDLLRISFSGESWIEVNDQGSNTVYRDIREAGDILEIHGTAPFSILLGDAPFTRLSFNGTEIDVSNDIRIDNSARLTVGL